MYQLFPPKFRQSFQVPVDYRIWFNTTKYDEWRFIYKYATTIASSLNMYCVLLKMILFLPWKKDTRLLNFNNTRRVWKLHQVSTNSSPRFSFELNISYITEITEYMCIVVIYLEKFCPNKEFYEYLEKSRFTSAVKNSTQAPYLDINMRDLIFDVLRNLSVTIIN